MAVMQWGFVWCPLAIGELVVVPFIVSHTRRRSFVTGVSLKKSFAEVNHENAIFRSSSSRVWVVAIALDLESESRLWLQESQGSFTGFWV